MADETNSTTPEPPKSVEAVKKAPAKPVKAPSKAKPAPAAAQNEPAKPADTGKTTATEPRKTFFQQAAEDLEREWGIRE
jgi:hypothetical protein